MGNDHNDQAGRRDSSAGLLKSRRGADAAPAFGIIAFIFGVIAISLHTMGVAALAMGALGLAFSWRGTRKIDSPDENPERSWDASAITFSLLGIVLGATGVVQAIAS